MNPLLFCFVSLIGMMIATFNSNLLQAEEKNNPPDKTTALAPVLEGEWWQVAGNPDLGKYTSKRQQPVDFGIWQAADGTWQLWSCIRGTKCGGTSRLFHGWEGKSLTDKNWKPLGIVMQADVKLGETAGGLQAPHVIQHEGTYYMFYGDYVNICCATSKDGKKFQRQIRPSGKTGIFSEKRVKQEYGHARDAMNLKIGSKWYCYYTAHHNSLSLEKFRIGRTYCRLSDDLKNWGKSHIVAEGSAYAKSAYSTECPHVVYHPPSQAYYLFNTQRYQHNNQLTTVFRSTDPLKFGINDQSKEVTTLPVAAPEIIFHKGKYYLVALNSELNGIRMCRLKWGKK